MNSIYIVFVAYIAALFGNTAPTQFSIPRARVLNFDMKIQKIEGAAPINLVQGDKLFVLTKHVTGPANGAGIRLHLILAISGSPQTWRITVTDESGNKSDELSSEAIGEQDSGIWTDTVHGASATVRVESSLPGSLLVDQYAYVTEPSYPQAIYGTDDRVSIQNAAPKWKKLSPAVIRLRFMMPEGEATCTAFLFASNLVMTNNHCISTEKELSSAVLDFGYDSSGSSVKSIKPRYLEYTNFDLDVSVLRLDRAMKEYTPLVLAGDVEPKTSAALAVIEHGGGQPKQLSLIDCSVKGTELKGQGASAVDFGHTCDTTGGSSGSPVFAVASGKVIGLHHFGFSDTDPNPINQAVKIKMILEACPESILKQLTAEKLR